VRLKLDENLPIQLRLLIEESGHDALTVLDQEIGGAKDAELASLCIAEERVLITLDTDFADIRMYPPGNHPGIDGCCRFVGGVKLRGIGGGFVRKMQGDVSDSQLHHRPHCPSKQGRDGPPGQPSATLRGLQLAEGRPAAGVSDCAVEGDGDVKEEADEYANIR